MTPDEFAAGVDALLPVLTILATGVVTVSVAIITAVAHWKNEQAKIAADKDREKARLTHEKELARDVAERANAVARQQKADAEAAAQGVAAEEEAARAKAVSELFFNLIFYIESHNPDQGDDVRFDHYFAERWPAFEMDLRRAIGALKGGELRNRLISIISAVNDEEIASYHGSSPHHWASWISDIGAELALTASRGEEPDAEILDRYKSFFNSYTDVGEYRHEQWEARREARESELRGTVSE